MGIFEIDDEVIMGLLDSKAISLKSALQMNLTRGIFQPAKRILPWLGVATVSLAIPDEALKVMILAKFGTLHKNEKIKGISNIISGLGMAATGMDILKDTVINHIDRDFLTNALSVIENPVPAALFGAGVMCITMKSSVVNSIMAPFLNSGIMPVEQAFAINAGQRATGGMDTAYQSIPLGRDVKRLAAGRLMVGFAGMTAYLTTVSINPEIPKFIHKLISSVPAFENPMVINQVFIALHSLLMFGVAIILINPLVKLLNIIIPDKDLTKKSIFQKIMDIFKLSKIKNNPAVIEETKIEFIKDEE